MSKKIFKYQLKSLNRRNSILMPERAEILSIQMQGSYPCIWALIDTEEEQVGRIIDVFGTGDTIEEDSNIERKFISTVQFPGNLVFHFFEVI